SMSLLIFHISGFISQLGVRPFFRCLSNVQQPTKLIRKKEQQSVSIPCSVTMSSCPKSLPQISWYVFRKNSHYQLDLKSHSLRYTLEHQGLKISSLSEADSGVYYCAAALLDVAHNGTVLLIIYTYHDVFVSRDGLKCLSSTVVDIASPADCVQPPCPGHHHLHKGTITVQYTPFQSNAMLHFQEKRYKAVIGAVDTKAKVLICTFKVLGEVVA
uniref:Ig-like domain-containing protein n=1 Tax=Sinocyclocheilus anshuiensis TaxID=1608454 RepID=A0A671LXN8_9TELE